MIGGFAVDYGNAQMQATLLQNTADSTAHTALLVRELHTATVATQAALVTAAGNMPASLYGDVVKPSDIVFGTWDQNSFSFTPNPTSKEAVMVTAHRSEGYLNAIPTFLFRLVGIDRMNERRAAIYTTYYPTCLREGFVANGVVDPLYTPSYISATSTQALTNKRVAQADLTPGQVYTASCSGGNALTITQGVVVSDIVLVTNCSIKFDKGVVLQNSVIATTSTSANSITSPSGLQVGKNDNCTSGGGAQILTLGGMNFPSDLQIYGSQLIASGDVDFSANASGIQGASIIAGGDISGTSNMVFGFCGTGMENNFQAEYFRLAM